MKIKKHNSIKLRGLSILLLIPIFLIVGINQLVENNKNVSANTKASHVHGTSSGNSTSESNTETATPNVDNKNKSTSNDNINKKANNNVNDTETLDPNVPLKSLEIKSYAGEHVSELTKTQVCTLYGNTPETMSNENSQSDNGNHGGCSFNEDGQLINLSLHLPSKLFYNGRCVNGLILNEVKELMAPDIDWIKRNSYIKLKNNWYLSLDHGKVNFAAWCMPGPADSKKEESDD